MASIGAETFAVMRGTPQPGGPSLEDITRANADNTALRELAARTGPFQVETTVDVALAADVKTKIEAYQALHGTIVTLVDGMGVTWTNVAVLAVQSRGAAAIGIVGGLTVAAGGSGFLVHSTWSLQLLKVAA